MQLRYPLLPLLAIAASAAFAQAPAVTWSGVLHDGNGAVLKGARIQITSGPDSFDTTTSEDGEFHFDAVTPKSYQLTVTAAGHSYQAASAVLITAAAAGVDLTLLSAGTVLLKAREAKSATGGEQLDSKAVSEIPLNKRDFSQLLLLSAGTAADPSGASNFTQQFAINGQRGVAATFALDGADISDPEQGGGTFTNFNVDAVLEIQSQAGVMPAEIGRGASGFTNIVTRSGTEGFHGSVFEFLRNSALDARNYFDYSSAANPGRIPPFKRNEFGFTNGGPLLIPFASKRHDGAFYFVEYQGFRQVLGTTQVISVPTAEQRRGIDMVTFKEGNNMMVDTLTVPVNADIAAVLARYPLPNLPTGTFGANTFATSSKVATHADQFSLRLDTQPGKKDHLLARVTFDNLDGPITNPDQTVLDKSFAVTYADRQRNAVLNWTHTVSPRLTFESSIAGIRTTPSFNTPNQTDPAVKFKDSLFEPFNSPGGSVTKSFTNLFQFREDISWSFGEHLLKAGGETRLWRDSSYFGLSPNGEYDFGGGPAYAPYDISSQSGKHNIHRGDALPDTLSALLTGSPFAYTRGVAPSYFSNGNRIGPAADSRTSFEAYVQDSWKVTPHLVLNYGLRFELYTPIMERAGRGAGFYLTPAGTQDLLINPSPVYKTRMNNWAPRVAADWGATPHLFVHAGAGLTTVPPNIWQDNYLTGSIPFVFYPRITATPGSQIAYGFQIQPSQLPRVYTPAGQDIFNGRRPNDVPVNTIFDVDRFERDLASVDGQPSALNVQAIGRDMGNAMLGTWSLGVERPFGKVNTTATYVGTSAWKLARVTFPNAYDGATAQFARFTQFDSTGKAVGGFGTESEVRPTSHSTYHSLQLSAAGPIGHGGPGIQASYTYSKSIDDTSTVAGTSATSNVGAISQAAPQNPFDNAGERGPSTFDTTHSFTLSLAQNLPFAHLPVLDHLSKRVVDGWQLINVSTLSSGLPFTVYSGIQQTGAGSSGSDRPDQIGMPNLSTRHAHREDYFGRGFSPGNINDNASFFSIPTNVPGGTGPNRGRFGSLSRNSFRGPAFYNYDISLVKDTPLGRRKSGSELVNLQFRSEFFNILNIVNMGLPSNTILGSGFGLINRTAGSSRQIQFSLKVAY